MPCSTDHMPAANKCPRDNDRRPGRTRPRDKLRSHARRTARAWPLDGQPLLGISVFAVLDMSLEDLLRRRFTTFRTIYLPTVADLAKHDFELLPTGQRPHFTVRLRRADDSCNWTDCSLPSALRSPIPSTGRILVDAGLPCCEPSPRPAAWPPVMPEGRKIGEPGILRRG